MFVVGNDTAPPVLAASLQIAAGQKMTLSMTVPRDYVGLHAPIDYIYASGYGGRVEKIEYSDLTAVLTAYSKVGTKLLDYTRVNPAQNGVVSVSAWLNAICSLMDAGSRFLGDNVILAATAYTQGIAVGAFLTTLQTISSCFGLDVIHISTNGGDNFKFCHPGFYVCQGDLSGKIIQFGLQAEKPTYNNCVLTRIAPVKQRDSMVVAPGRGSGGVQYTSQQTPYLNGVCNAVSIDNVVTRLRDLSVLISPADLAAWRIPYDLSRYAAPLFGDYVQYEMTETEDWSDPIEPGWTSRYQERSQDKTQRDMYVYGLWALGQTMGHFHHDHHVVRLERDEAPVVDDFNDDHDIVNDDFYVDYTDKYYSYAFKSIGYILTPNGWVVRRGQIGQELETWVINKPKLSDWPWLLLASRIDKVESNTSVDTESGRISTYSNWTKTETYRFIEKSGPLFDAGFDDVYHPPTIDPNPPAEISLNKHSETWFDATAAPAEDYQFMGLGLVANISYSLNSNSERIALKPGHEPGILTARWQDGSKIVKHAVYDDFDLSTLNASSAVTCTLVSSDQDCFTTADGSETGQIFTLTSDVWTTKQVALACVPYVLRQQCQNVKVDFVIPFVLLAIDDAIDIVGKTSNINGFLVYITAVSVDFGTESYSFQGYAITG